MPKKNDATRIDAENPTQTTSDDATVNDAPEVADGCAAQGPQAPLLAIAALANRHRVPSWQLAAVMRLMGWTDDKLVTEIEFTDALTALGKRRIGGGRM